MTDNGSRTAEREMLRESARELVTKHAPPSQVQKWDEDGSYPVDLFDRIAGLGWYGLGSEVGDPIENRAELLVAVCEELGHASSDLVALFNLNVSGVRDVERWGTREQKDQLLPQVFSGRARFSIAVSEPDVGSDSAAITTRGLSTADGWVLHGQKTYCEGAGLPSAVITVYARTGDSGRKRDQLSAFLVPADHPGVRLQRMPALGRNISGIYEVFLDDVALPHDALLGQPGDGWQILKNRLVLERLMISAGFVGCAAEVLDMTARYANERKQFGRTIGSFQGVSHPLAELYIRLDAARCAVERTAVLFDRGAPCEVESAMAKFLTGQLYAETTATAMQVQGAYGYVRDHTLPMHYADGIIARVVAGPPQIQLNVVARAMGLDVSA
jgi:alkylation response protein AidB-like acyl-CoA dehydrogenase